MLMKETLKSKSIINKIEQEQEKSSKEQSIKLIKTASVKRNKPNSLSCNNCSITHIGRNYNKHCI